MTTSSHVTGSNPKGVHDSGRADSEHGHHEHPRSLPWIARHREIVLPLAAGFVLATAWGLERRADIPHGIAVAIYAVSYVLGAWTLVSHTIGKLWRGRFSPDIDLLMLLAACGAAVTGAWSEGGFLLFLFSLAHAMEEYATGRARKAIAALADLAPPMARVKRGGAEASVPVAEVQVGETTVVLPGERIPVDGEVTVGSSSVNQAPITGESVPVEKARGDEVFAGTVNGEGALEVVTTRAAGDRTLDRVIKLVSEARSQRAPTQVFTDRFQKFFVPAILIADVLLIVVPPLALGWPWSESLYRGMTLLVGASPCALALGTPAAVLAGIAQAARNGVLIKGGEHLENLGMVKAIAFDKTGTLTVGKPEVTDVVPSEGVSELELLSVAAAVERRSQHPLAKAIVREAETRGLELPEAGDLQSVTARGVRSIVNGRNVDIGTLRMWSDRAGSVPATVTAAAEKVCGAGRSIVVVKDGECWLGVIGVADRPRPGARATLQRLRDIGIERQIMLTGDNKEVGEAIGREIGVDEVRADLLPEGKVKSIGEVAAQYGPTAMVGDGVNDAPALANATVGIAMGGAGTAAALETADAALMGDDLTRLPFAIALARKSRAVIRQNLYISMGVVFMLIVVAASGWARIGPVVIIHEGSTLVVLANALRLLAVMPEQAAVEAPPTTPSDT